MAIVRSGYMGSGLITGDNYVDVTYYYSGTSEAFVVPDGVTSVVFETWGGGGKGFGDTASGPQTDGFPGGGGGAYAKTTLSVSPGDSFTITVGAGSTTEGVDGGDTTVVSGATTYCKAAGGASPATQGSGGLGGLVADSVGDVRYAGGNGTAGTTSSPPGTPGGAGGGAAGSTGAGSGSVGADEFGGDGGAGGAYAGNPPTSSDGDPGELYGAGGGGGSSYDGNNSNGGDGAKGLIRITYSILQ